MNYTSQDETLFKQRVFKMEFWWFSNRSTQPASTLSSAKWQRRNVASPNWINLRSLRPDRAVIHACNRRFSNYHYTRFKNRNICSCYRSNYVSFAPIVWAAAQCHVSVTLFSTKAPKEAGKWFGFRESCQRDYPLSTNKAEKEDVNFDPGAQTLRNVWKTGSKSQL